MDHIPIKAYFPISSIFLKRLCRPIVFLVGWFGVFLLRILVLYTGFFFGFEMITEIKFPVQ